MPESFEALIVIVLVLLPGGLYTWYFEREVGAWGAGASDRLLRLVGSSAVFLAIYAYPAYYLWTNYLHHRAEVRGRIVYKNLIEQGRALPWYLFLLPVLYVAVPILLGWLAGRAVVNTRRGQSGRWSNVASAMVGRDPAPRAWDQVFLGSPAATLRITLKDGRGRLAGKFGEKSYAAGYGEELQDLYLEKQYRLLEDGRFAATAEGDFVSVDSGVLIALSEISYIEFFMYDRR